MKRLFCIILTLFLILRAETSEAIQGTSYPIYYKDKAMVLVYHDMKDRLEPGDSNQATITVKQFQDHLQLLKERGFRIISMQTFAGFMLEGKAVPPNAIVLTFDDGYESFYSRAYPVLKQYGAAAYNFAIGTSSDLYNAEAEPHLSWEQMRELKANGMGIYSHTYNSHRMMPTDKEGHSKPALTDRLYLKQKQRQETEPEYRNRIASDLKFMEKRLDIELGDQPGMLAFPFGAYNETALEEGRNAGIELFFTVEEGMNVAGTRLVRRINAGEPYMTAEALWNHVKKLF